ncbi:MAG: hypothetical protein NVV60_03415 [Luteimonas sp.]|nr:hypothetical protein [Luteimonas sp.]
MSFPAILLSIAAFASTATAAESMTDPKSENAGVHDRCSQLRVGMNYRDALAVMGREPDSTLSGHSAAGPGGNPPPGSYAIDFWYGTDSQGVSVISSVRYSGGTVESVDCARPANHDSAMHSNSSET